ncbi:MAG: L-threonylcarbamoyladenylate synthase [Methanimicrococcus sp.]|nr:L-threonylcarbamoyladenylate synthase [Methanimicrococcus sp.]
MIQTKIYKVGPDTEPDALDAMISETAKALLNGKTAAFPTETVYGIGASIFNEEAVLKIYQIKGRPPEKPLSILLGAVEDMGKAASDIPDSARLLAEKFWPGPLTMILKKKEEISDKVTAGKETVGLRIPAHPVPLGLVRLTGPLACPSANLSGTDEPRSGEDVYNNLGGKIDILIDGGKTELGIPSTIIDLTVNPPQILRKGGLEISEIKKVIGEVTE